MKIPFYTMPDMMNDGSAASIVDSIADGWVSPGGPKSKELVNLLRETIRTPYKHIILTTSGTIALGLMPGKNVAVPAYGFMATANAYASLGATIHFVDVTKATGCMDPDALDEVLTENRRGSLREQIDLVCYVGFSGAMHHQAFKIEKLCKEFGVPLMEDAACGLVAPDINFFAEQAALSFSGPKIVTAGQGGAFMTNNDELAERAEAWIDHGGSSWRQDGIHRGIGTNLRMAEINAALALAQLKTLDARIERRTIQRRQLYDGLGEYLWLEEGDGVFHLGGPFYNIILVDDPYGVMMNLNGAGIDAKRLFRTANTHPAYAYYGNINTFPNADWWTAHAVYLPFGEMSQDQLDYMIETVKRVTK